MLLNESAEMRSGFSKQGIRDGKIYLGSGFFCRTMGGARGIRRAPFLDGVMKPFG